MVLGRAAIVSLVELTIDFLLSIINAVLTTKQRGNTRTHQRTPPPHTQTNPDFVQYEAAQPLWGKCKSNINILL